MLTIVILVVVAAIFAAAVCGVWRALDPDFQDRRRKRPDNSGVDAMPAAIDSADSGSRWFGSSSSSDSNSCDTGSSDAGGACDTGGGGGGDSGGGGGGGGGD